MTVNDDIPRASKNYLRTTKSVAHDELYDTGVVDDICAQFCLPTQSIGMPDRSLIQNASSHFVKISGR
jgi:hypothetical protein